MAILMAMIAIPLFVVALLNRASVEPQELSGELVAASGVFPVTITEVNFFGKSDRLHAVIKGDAAPPSRLALEVTIHEPIKSPNLLLYWMQDEDFRDAVLIGSFPTVNSATIELTPQMKMLDGSLVLYSLGHQEEFARAPIRMFRGGEEP